MSEWILNRNYNDRGEYEPGDQFTSWLRVDKKQRWGIANASGIRTLASGYNNKKIKKNQYSCVVLVSNYVNVAWDNPWNDKLNDDSEKLDYWGDAKFHKTNRVDDWRGNKILVRIHEEILLKNIKKIPPFFYFRRFSQGKVTFMGTFVLENLIKKPFYDEDNDALILNYLCKMKRLPESVINSDWIIHRAKTMNDNTKYAPSSWKKYLTTL